MLLKRTVFLEAVPEIEKMNVECFSLLGNIDRRLSVELQVRFRSGNGQDKNEDRAYERRKIINQVCERGMKCFQKFLFPFSLFTKKVLLAERTF
jgi:hypothetical protein